MAGAWKDIGKEVRRSSAINRIARNVAWEEVSNPRPLDFSRVPPSTEALTPEYLTAVMCVDHPGAKVVGIELGKESSGSADRRAFSVTYNGEGERAKLPKMLFHKFTKGFYTRLHLLRCGISRNEERFYNVIRPEVGFEVPKVFRAAFEHTSCRLSIILEDVIASKGAIFFEVGTPISKSDAEAMLTILGSLHSTYWESPHLDSKFDWLLHPCQYSGILEEGMELEQLMATGLERAQSVLSSELASRKSEIWAAYHRSMELSSSGPRTYIHGDPHLRNYYKTANGTIGLADWQVTLKGSWSHDVAYTMITSLPVDKRRAWDKDLLAHYVECLKAGGVQSLAFDAAWERYRRQTMYTFVGWLVTIGFGALQPDMQPASESLEIIRRAAAAVEDLDSINLLRRS
jgi:Phosphotransferase enzyme family